MSPNSDPKVILLTSPSSYRGKAFMTAARRLRLPVIQVFDLPEDLAERAPGGHSVNFKDIQESARKLTAMHESEQVSAILSVDDSATELAAVASDLAGLPANDPAAARAARDKFLMRTILSERGVKCPGFVEFPASADPEHIAGQVSYPCVVKARRLSGSRGVIRSNDPDEFVAAFKRVAAIIEKDGEDLNEATILVEDYLPGFEVAVEGLVTDGDLKVLAIFDKPDPLVGPFFEETIYVTPSRLSETAQRNIRAETEAAARALGLRHGPIHAELRINNDEAWLLEVAGRSIGGL